MTIEDRIATCEEELRKLSASMQRATENGYEDAEYVKSLRDSQTCLLNELSDLRRQHYAERNEFLNYDDYDE